MDRDLRISLSKYKGLARFCVDAKSVQEKFIIVKVYEKWAADFTPLLPNEWLGFMKSIGALQGISCPLAACCFLIHLDMNPLYYLSLPRISRTFREISFMSKGF